MTRRAASWLLAITLVSAGGAPREAAARSAAGRDPSHATRIVRLDVGAKSQAPVLLRGVLWPEDPDAACVSKRFVASLLNREGARPVVMRGRGGAAIEISIRWIAFVLEPEEADNVSYGPLETREDLATLLLVTGAIVVDPSAGHVSAGMRCRRRAAANHAEWRKLGVWLPTAEQGRCADTTTSWSAFGADDTSESLDSCIRDTLACLPAACGDAKSPACNAYALERVRWLARPDWKPW